MISFVVRKEKIKQHNANQPQIPNHPCRILIIRDSGPGKPMNRGNKSAS